MRISPPDFKRTYASGKSVANRFLVLYYLKTEKDQNRVGFSISKRVGGAVERNKLKRRMSGIYKTKAQDIKYPYDLVIICRPKAAEIDYQNMVSAFLSVLIKANLMEKSQ